MSVNRVILVGRLTRDPEHRTTPNGKAYATFGLAVRKRFKPADPNERDADFFNIKVWGQSAEYVKNYLTKGRLVSVDGRLETRRYTDQQGVQKDIFEIVAENVQGLDRPRDDAGGAGTGGGHSSAGGDSARTSTAQEDEYDPFAE
jgi:single-strand DNA-binding protein